MPTIYEMLENPSSSQTSGSTSLDELKKDLQDVISRKFNLEKRINVLEKAEIKTDPFGPIWRYKTLLNTLWFIGFAGGLGAGISEIVAIEKRKKSGAEQNWWTPLLLLLVKVFLIPYYCDRILFNTPNSQKNTFGQKLQLLLKDRNILTLIIAGTLWLVSFIIAVQPDDE